MSIRGFTYHIPESIIKARPKSYYNALSAKGE
jgi:hypothetical protein